MERLQKEMLPEKTKCSSGTRDSLLLEIVSTFLPHTHRYIPTGSLCRTYSKNYFPKIELRWAKSLF